MKVLFLIDCIGLAGKERQLVEHLKGLKKRKDIRCKLVVLSKHVHLPLLDGLDIETHLVPRKVKKDPSVFLRLYRICKQFEPDIIHSWERMCSVYGIPVAKILGIKFINGAIRNAPPSVKRFSGSRIQEKLTFPFSDVVLANSYAGLQSFKAPKRKSYCIHNGFDFSRIKNVKNSGAIRKKFNIDTPSVVGMVGTFNNRKDYETYLLSAMRILTKRQDITFLAIGDGSNALGDERKSTYEKCQNMVTPEFEHKVSFLGRQENVESIVNILDVGVLMTNQDVHGEGISNSIMEYMALGKPVVATNGGGTGEIVVHKETGFLVGHRNVEELEEKVEFLLDNKGVAKAMGAAGRERLLKEFSMEKMTDRYLELYQRCLSNRS